MDLRSLARRFSIGIYVIACLLPAAGRAQLADCSVFDVDGNGRIESSDAQPLITDHAMLSRCYAIDMTDALGCRAFDVNGDGAVSTLDQIVVRSPFELFLACLTGMNDSRASCASVDADSDGRVTLRDFPVIERLHAEFLACVATDLEVLACREVDYNEDARISGIDHGLLRERFAAFGACLGSSIGGSNGFFLSRSRLASLPTRGPAWQRVLSEAESAYLPPDLADQDGAANTRTWAQALVGVRLSRADLIGDVLRALREIVDRELPWETSTLSLGRELLSYVLAADLIDLPAQDPVLDRAFREKLRSLREIELQGRTLVTTHEDRPNNWGTHAGATRIAIALYLGDEADLAAAAAVHRGWLGESGVYSGFRYGELSWQAEEHRPVGVNRPGARRGGIDLDGALPEEMRRGGSLADPPARTGYAWEALQGATVATELLARNGYPDAWRWGDAALLRAVDYLARLDAAHGGWWADGDDRWNVWLVNHGTGRSYPTEAGVTPGKNIGFTDWTHAPGS